MMYFCLNLNYLLNTDIYLRISQNVHVVFDSTSIIWRMMSLKCHVIICYNNYQT